MPAREVTQEELEDAKRLKRIWNEKKEALHLSQVKAARELGYNSQGAVSQYINGKVGLNLQAAAKFAKLLRVNVVDISPRLGKLVEKPLPPALDAYSAPQTGELGGVHTQATLDWFAFSKTFCSTLGVKPENLKLVRLEDDSFKEFPIGTVFLVEDGYHGRPEDGVYLLQQGDSIIARRLTVEDDIILSAGQGKKQRLSKDAFGLLRIIARVLSVFQPVGA